MGYSILDPGGGGGRNGKKGHAAIFGGSLISSIQLLLYLGMHLFMGKWNIRFQIFMHFFNFVVGPLGDLAGPFIQLRQAGQGETVYNAYMQSLAA